jgi:hypothetical protein
MEDVRRLAKYEFPDFGSKVQESASEVTLYPATAKLELLPAINLVEASLLVLYLYFWLFQCEAMGCDSFPARGTLFGVFYATLISKLSFIVLALLPAAAGGYLAWESLSDNSLAAVLAFFTAILSLPIAYAFVRPVLPERKSILLRQLVRYFRKLRN